MVLANFIVPLYFKVWAGDSWNLPKTTAMSILSAPITASTALSFTLEPKWSPIMSAATAIAGSWVASTHTSIRPKMSIYGSGVRMEGLSQFSTTLSYFLASSSVKNKKLILGAIFASAIVMAGMSYIQWLGVFDYTKKGERPPGTLGNADFYPHYLIMALPYAIQHFLDSKNIKHKIAFLTAISFISGAVIISRTRGAYVGLLTSIPVLMLMQKKETIKDNKFWLAGLSAALCGIFLLMWKNGMITDLLRGGFRQTRFYIWIGVLKCFLEKPIFGVGNDSLRVAILKNKPLKYSLMEPMTNPDRAHNQYIDELAMRGITGFASYMWFLFELFGAAEQVKGNDRLIIIASLLAYLGQNLVSFGTPSTNLAFYTQAGLLAAETNKPVKINPFVKIIGAISAVAISLLNAKLGIKNSQAEKIFVSAEKKVVEFSNLSLGEDTSDDSKIKLSEKASKLANEALVLYKKATEIAPYVSKYKVNEGRGCVASYGDFLFKCSLNANAEQASGLCEQARKIWIDAVEFTGGPENVYARLGNSYMVSYNKYQDPKYIEQAIKWFELSAETDPGNYTAYGNLVNLYRGTNQTEKLDNTLKKMLRYNPNYDEKNEEEDI